MSRQNRNQARDRKNEEAKRDVADNSQRFSREQKEEVRNERDRSEPGETTGLDKYRLNDLYERSSI